MQNDDTGMNTSDMNNPRSAGSIYMSMDAGGKTKQPALARIMPTWGETVLAGLRAAGAPDAEAAEASKAAVELETAARAAMASPGPEAWGSVWAAVMNASALELVQASGTKGREGRTMDSPTAAHEA